MSNRTSEPNAAPRLFISAELHGTRLDKATRTLFDLPWIKARSWIDTGKVFIDGNPVADQGYAVQQGQRIELRMDTPKPKARVESALDPKAVLYFDAHVVIVNKPAGMLSIPHRESEDTETLDALVSDFLRINDPDTKRGRMPLGVVHRIDKETSGLLVFTRTFAAKQSLSQQFRDHTVERKYFAIAHGQAKSQTIVSHIARDAGEGWRGSVPEGTVNKLGEHVGRRAVTHIEAVEALRSATLVACRLETGRTHQIRIHLSEAGHPIVGEKVYIRNFAGAPIPAPRVMLHAAELGFYHPAKNQRLSWQQPLPPDFKSCLRRLAAPG